MKKMFLLTAAIVTAVTTTGAKSNKLAGEDYNRVEVGYAPMFMSDMFYWGSPASTAHGIQAGYTRGIHLSKKWPMYIEVSGQVQYNHKYKSNIDTSLDLLRLNIPVAFTWRFTPGSRKLFTIAPFLGINFGINMLYHMDGENQFGDNNDIYSAKRFQLGMAEGVNFTYKRWNAGIAYIWDFMPLDKSELYNASNTTGSLVIRAGYEF